MAESASNERPPADNVLVQIADYVCDRDIESTDAYTMTRYPALKSRNRAC